MDDFLLGDENHGQGNASCGACYKGYPLKCRCGGLVHCTFEGAWETPDGGIRDSYIEACDKCGADFNIE